MQKNKLIIIYVLLFALPSLFAFLTLATCHDCNRLLVSDYIVPWSAGKIAYSGHLEILNHTNTFNQWLTHYLGKPIDTYYWSYPPHLLMFDTLFSFIPLYLSWIVWGLVSLALMALCLKKAEFSPLWIFVILFCPASIDNILDGQNGALTSGCLLLGLYYAYKKPYLAGFILSCVTMKPQMALTIPFCVMGILISDYRIGFKIGISLAVSMLFWFLSSSFIFGFKIWFDYIQIIVPQAQSTLISLDSVPFGTLTLQYFIITIFATVRSFGGNLHTAYLIQTFFTLLSASILVITWKSSISHWEKIALSLALVPIISPYLMNYDMICIAISMVIVATKTNKMNPTIFISGLIGFILPNNIFTLEKITTPGLGGIVYTTFAFLLCINILKNSAQSTKKMLT